MKYKLTTTLDLLHGKGACIGGYRELVKFLGTDYPKDKEIYLTTILESNGVQDMCWCLGATIEDSLAPRLLIAADFAESVLHYFTEVYFKDDRPAKAIRATRDKAHGNIDDAAIEATVIAAYAAYSDAANHTAEYAAAASRVAAYTAASASAAFSTFAYSAAYAAAAAAAYAAATAYAAVYPETSASYASATGTAAAGAAAGTAGTADADDARKQERGKQAKIIRKWLKMEQA